MQLLFQLMHAPGLQEASAHLCWVVPLRRYLWACRGTVAGVQPYPGLYDSACPERRVPEQGVQQDTYTYTNCNASLPVRVPGQEGGGLLCSNSSKLADPSSWQEVDSSFSRVLPKKRIIAKPCTQKRKRGSGSFTSWSVEQHQQVRKFAASYIPFSQSASTLIEQRRQFFNLGRKSA